jgi:thymidine kinase
MIGAKAEFVVYTGPMFSGKTELLMKRLMSAIRARRKILIIKPRADTRTENFIATRRIVEGKPVIIDQLPAEIVENSKQLFELVEQTNCDVIGIDEAQFFGRWLVHALQRLFNGGRGIDIIAAGLELDAWQEPFGIMPEILAICDDSHKLTADCFVCGQKARYTQKIGGSDSRIEVGDAKSEESDRGKAVYEARCGNCWIPPRVKK